MAVFFNAKKEIDKCAEERRLQKLKNKRPSKLGRNEEERRKRRYVHFEQFEKIAMEMNYTFYYLTKRLLATAIKKYAEL